MTRNNYFIKIISCILCLVFVIILNDRKSFNAKADSGSAEIIMEINSNRVLYEYNSDLKKYMASTTKIVTAILVIETCNMSDIITVTSKTIGVEGSSIYLEEGEKITIKELLYGLMLRSGNDCAETLAVYCSGSIKNFANEMNLLAKRIGAKNSNFTNPHGLHDDNHYTTAYDLALISCYAMKNDIFREIVSCRSIDITFSTQNYKRHLVNKNKMLNEFAGSTGIKTGYTKKAGRCLVSSCKRNGMELVCVVLNCPPMFERSKVLLSNCFSEFKNYLLVESDNIIGFIEDQNKKTYALTIKNDITIPLKDRERQDVKIVYNYPYKTSFDRILSGNIGFVEIFYQNNLIFKEKIYTIIDREN